jgi:predicted permease
VLRVAPLRGRWFVQSDEHHGHNRCAVLSERAWRNRFGADPAILGRSIILNEESFEIIGVMPAGFAFPSAETELWIPIQIDSSDVGYMWGDNNLWPIGRLRDRMTLASAQAELEPLTNRIRPLFPWRMPDAWGLGATVVLHSKSLVKDAQAKLFALSAAALLLLLIACGNVANLLLARTMRREREFAMREALGARRSRLIRQLLTENCVLVAVGGSIGLAAAAVIVKCLPLLLPKDTPRLADLSPDPTLLLAAAGSMLVTVVLFSIMPMLLLLRQRRESVAGRVMTASQRSSSISLGLMGAELALATALLIGAGLMGRTLWRLAQVDSGIHATNVVSARLSAGPSRCGNPDFCWALLQDIDRTLMAQPGVRSVNWADAAPLDGQLAAVSSEVEDHPKPAGAPAYVLWRTLATPGYFRALGISVRAGRVFSEADRLGTVPVVVISQSTAQRFWPDSSAIGKRLRTLSDNQWRTVVGVVSDVAHYSLTGFPPWIDGVEYFALAQDLPHLGKNIQLTIFIESSRPGTAATLQRALRQRFPDVVVSHIESLGALRSGSVSNQRSTAALLTLLAGLGLLLGVAGVYGVISHRSQQRTREVGIRLALGASAGQVFSMVLWETLLVSLAGTTAGIAAALGLSRFLSSLLFGITAHDSATLTICPIVLLAAALLAAGIPAQRAARTDPALTLREE